MALGVTYGPTDNVAVSAGFSCLFCMERTCRIVGGVHTGRFRLSLTGRRVVDHCAFGVAVPQHVELARSATIS